MGIQQAAGNPEFEARNPKQIPMSQIPMSQTGSGPAAERAVWNFGISDFERGARSAKSQGNVGIEPSGQVGQRCEIQQGLGQVFELLVRELIDAGFRFRLQRSQPLA